MGAPAQSGEGGDFTMEFKFRIPSNQGVVVRQVPAAARISAPIRKRLECLGLLHSDSNDL